jgi:REP element-mobilizing transposase RayT
MIDYRPIKCFMPRSPEQLSLPVLRTWGGRRSGAGRKLAPGRRPSVPHRARPAHEAAHPVHVTLRTTRAVRCLRSARVFPAVRGALAVSSHEGFRIIHFSVQDDHVHLLVEGETRERLSSGLRGLAIRMARAVNHVLGRRGAVWADRYHARALSTPREVRHSLVYVLTNRKKHDPEATGLDPCSSAQWFDGWRRRPVPSPDGPPLVMRPRTWLAVVGWRRHGLVDMEERPRSVTSGRRGGQSLHPG